MGTATLPVSDPHHPSPGWIGSSAASKRYPHTAHQILAAYPSGTMFGGLEVKGSGGGEDGGGEPEAAPVPASSGFSFLSGAADPEPEATAEPEAGPEVEPEAEPEPEAAAPSAFGFLSAPAAAPAAADEASSSLPDVGPAASGFSFLSSTSEPSAPAVAPAAAEKEEEEEDAPAAAPAESGFGFLSAPLSGADGDSPLPAAAEAEPDPSEAPSSGSGFGFLSQPSAAGTNGGPTEAEAQAEAGQPAAPAEAGSMFSFLSGASGAPPLPSLAAPPPSLAPSPAAPAGSGAVFGGLAAAKPPTGRSKIKKRSRAKKVGMASGPAAMPVPPAQQQQPLPAPAPVAQPSPPRGGTPAYGAPAEGAAPPSPVPVASEGYGEVPQPDGASAKDDAEEAAREAERFMEEMRRKEQAASAAAPSPPGAAPLDWRGMSTTRQEVTEDYGGSGGGGGYSFTPPVAVPNYDEEPPPGATPTDEAYLEAEAAAEKARAAMAEAAAREKAAKQAESTAFGFFKKVGLFGSGSSSVKSERSVSSGGGPSGGAMENADRPPSVVQATRSTSASSAPRSPSVPEGRAVAPAPTPPPVSAAEAREEADRRAREAAEIADRQRAAAIEREHEERRRRQEQEEREAARRAAEEAERNRVKLPQEKFVDTLVNFASSSRSSAKRAAQLRMQKAKLLEEREAATRGIALSTGQAENATSQQSEAAEREDFELADRLAEVIEQHTADAKEHERMLDHIRRAMNELESAKEGVMRELTECFSDVESSLRQFKNEQEETERNDGIKIKERFQNTSKRLSSEEERLSIDFKHIERDEGLVKEEKKELEGTIQEQTSDMEKLRDQAMERLEMVSEEIADLRALLKAKEQVAADLQSEYAHQESAITKVREKFSRQLVRLEKKEAALSDNRKEWETEKKHFEHLKESHESATQAHSEALLAHNEMMTVIKDEISTASQVEAIIMKEIVNGESHDAPDEAGGLDAEVVKYEAEAHEAKQVLDAAVATKASLSDELSSIEKLIPVLEDQKKVAAGSRDFKSAAKASKEIKEAVAKKDRLEAELSGDASERVSVAEANFDKISTLLNEKRARSHDQEKEGAVTRMGSLGERIDRLQKLKKEVCGDDVEEGGFNVASVAASILDSEIDALKARGAVLGEKFGGWDEVIESIAVSDDATDEAVAGEDENEREAKAGEAEGEVPEEAKMSRKEAIEAYRRVKNDLEMAGAELELAIVEEDYDKAAEIDETITDLNAKLARLGLTDADLEDDAATGEESGGDVDADIPEDDEPAEPQEEKDEAGTADDGEDAGAEVQDDDVPVDYDEPEEPRDEMDRAETGDEGVGEEEDDSIREYYDGVDVTDEKANGTVVEEAINGEIKPDESRDTATIGADGNEEELI